jgi:hypothetical protein
MANRRYGRRPPTPSRHARVDDPPLSAVNPSRLHLGGTSARLQARTHRVRRRPSALSRADARDGGCGPAARTRRRWGGREKGKGGGRGLNRLPARCMRARSVCSSATQRDARARTEVASKSGISLPFVRGREITSDRPEEEEDGVRAAKVPIQAWKRGSAPSSLFLPCSSRRSLAALASLKLQRRARHPRVGVATTAAIVVASKPSKPSPPPPPQLPPPPLCLMTHDDGTNAHGPPRCRSCSLNPSPSHPALDQDFLPSARATEVPVPLSPGPFSPLSSPAFSQRGARVSVSALCLGFQTGGPCASPLRLPSRVESCS